MTIGLGSDHLGFVFKERLCCFLPQRGHEVRDLGAYSHEPVGYPGTAALVAALILIRHTSNIRRLLAGTEPRLGRPSPAKGLQTPPEVSGPARGERSMSHATGGGRLQCSPH